LCVIVIIIRVHVVNIAMPIPVFVETKNLTIRLLKKKGFWQMSEDLDVSLCSTSRKTKRSCMVTLMLTISISLSTHSLLTVSGHVKAHVVLTCTSRVSRNHLPVIVASDRP